MLNHIKDNLKIKIINELHNDIIIEEKEVKFTFSKLDIMNNPDLFNLLLSDTIEFTRKEEPNDEDYL